MAKKNISVEASSMADDVIVPTSTAVVTEASTEALAALAAMFPQADVINRVQFPKLVFKSQTVLDEDEETVLVKAGTFFVECPSEEVDEEGKKTWDKVELGKELEGHIILHRKRLQYWDSKANEFTSSPIYDNNTDVIPLFKSGEFVTEGTPAELKKLYPEMKEFENKKTGEKELKEVSKLRDATVLYILVGGELLELTIAGTSRYSWLDYLKSTAVPTVITTINSTPQKQGSTKWNQMTFKAGRTPTADEANLALATLAELQEGIQAEKDFYARKRAESAAGAVAATALPSDNAVPQLEKAKNKDDF